MKIFLKKFGSTLTSRQAGKEAYSAIRPLLNTFGKDEKIEVDFDGVVTFSPSWADEFFTPLQEAYKDRLIILETHNPSVRATFELLDSLREKKSQ